MAKMTLTITEMTQSPDLSVSYSISEQDAFRIMAAYGQIQGPVSEYDYTDSDNPVLIQVRQRTTQEIIDEIARKFLFDVLANTKRIEQQNAQIQAASQINDIVSTKI